MGNEVSKRKCIGDREKELSNGILCDGMLTVFLISKGEDKSGFYLR